MGQRSISLSSFPAMFHQMMEASPIVNGPLHCHLLQRDGHTVVIFGEVHGASVCGAPHQRSLPDLLGEVLRHCQVPVHLFVEDHIDYELEPRPHNPEKTPQEALDVIRQTAATLQTQAMDNVSVHYTDTRSRLCIANHSNMVQLLSTLLPLRTQHPQQIHQALVRIIDEVVRRPLLAMVQTTGPQIFAKYRKRMRPEDQTVYRTLLRTLRGKMDKVDQRVRSSQPNDDWLAMLEEYAKIANRLNDLYTMARVLRPGAAVSILYLGANHATFLADLLRRTMRFRLLRRYGRQDPAAADGCLRTQQKI